MTDLSDAEIVVVGGGAVGCGVAYSLAKAGKPDVLVVEKENSVAAATTAQAAGLVGQVRSTIERTRLAMWSVRTFSEMQRDSEFNPSWRQVGSMRIALTSARVEEFERLKAVADKAGLDVEFIDSSAARDRWPVLDFARAKAILWCPSDGYLQPSDLTMAYRRHGQRMGVRYATGTEVQGILAKDGRVTGVETDAGTIRCELVVNAAGVHAYHIARLAGLELPILPVRHEYFVSVDAQGIESGFPVLRIPDATLYARAEVGSLLLGGWEPGAQSVEPREFSLRSDPPQITPDWDVLASFADQFAPLFPQVGELGIRSVFKGWPTFTPDGRFIIGESSRLKGFVMAGGCNAHGVSGSAGIGRHVVESILEERPSSYVRSLSPDRFTETSWDWTTARQQAQRVYETYYALDH